MGNVLDYIAIATAAVAIVYSTIALYRASLMRHCLDHRVYDLRHAPYEYWFYQHPELERIWITIRKFEDLRGITLTPAARQMLFLPIVEFYESDRVARKFFLSRFGDSPENLVVAAIDKIFSELQESPSLLDRERDQGQGSIRSTTSVVKAFWRRFCQIPPFCSGEE